MEPPAEIVAFFYFRAHLTWDHAQIFVEPRAPTVTSYLLHLFKFSWFLFSHIPTSPRKTQNFALRENLPLYSITHSFYDTNVRKSLDANKLKFTQQECTNYSI